MSDADAVETVTFTIEGPDGESSDVTLPAGLVDLFAEEGDSRATVVADISLMAFVQRAHAVVHHSEGEPSDELRALEQSALDLFEERFGLTYAEATGHAH